jgi:hypothetical protein
MTSASPRDGGCCDTCTSWMLCGGRTSSSAVVGAIARCPATRPACAGHHWSVLVCSPGVEQRDLAAATASRHAGPAPSRRGPRPRRRSGMQATSFSLFLVQIMLAGATLAAAARACPPTAPWAMQRCPGGLIIFKATSCCKGLGMALMDFIKKQFIERAGCVDGSPRRHLVTPLPMSATRSSTARRSRCVKPAGRVRQRRQVADVFGPGMYS